LHSIARDVYEASTTPGIRRDLARYAADRRFAAQLGIDVAAKVAEARSDTNVELQIGAIRGARRLST
jgi:hypothetical protein